MAGARFSMVAGAENHPPRLALFATCFLHLASHQGYPQPALLSQLLTVAQPGYTKGFSKPALLLLSALRLTPKAWPCCSTKAAPSHLSAALPAPSQPFYSRSCPQATLLPQGLSLASLAVATLLPLGPCLAKPAAVRALLSQACCHQACS